MSTATEPPAQIAEPRPLRLPCARCVREGSTGLRVITSPGGVSVRAPECFTGFASARSLTGACYAYVRRDL